ncbi:hypothetical protein [uncultured Actinomyces sp.]|uniref:hypothetical protein n=1 Tax=uncultured Actinomyces sp. TaxID=249061 RepID=UPI0028DD12C5|nr:hypothetical protein [uncultured Actinomyces sp.]
MRKEEHQTSRPQVRGVEDRRRPAHGWGRLLVAFFAVVGLVIFVPALVALIREPSQDPVVGVINVVAGLLYLLLAVCVAHNGRRMRIVGWICLTALLTGAVLLGVVTAAGLAPDLESSVWLDGGRHLWFVPLVAPVVAGVWMWMSDPRRIVVRAERQDR